MSTGFHTCLFQHCYGNTWPMGLPYVPTAIPTDPDGFWRNWGRWMDTYGSDILAMVTETRDALEDALVPSSAPRLPRLRQSPVITNDTLLNIRAPLLQEPVVFGFTRDVTLDEAIQVIYDSVVSEVGYAGFYLGTE